MRFKVTFSAVFLGVLAAFVVWSVQWALDDRREVTFDVPGEVTTFTMAEDPGGADDRQARQAVQELKRYLADRAFALVIASNGDGTPGMLVHDPAHRIAWFPATASESNGEAGAFLFKGSYSERRWTQSSVSPLLPRGTTVAGVLTPPSGVGTMQFVRAIGADRLPLGRYLMTTTDGAAVARVRELVSAQGLRAQEPRQIPLLPYLAQDPFIFVTVMFLLLGLVCAAMSWWVLVGSRARELVIRRRHGARVAALIWQVFARGVAGVAVGTVLGVVLSGVVVRTVGREALTGSEYAGLGTAVLVGVALTVTVWLVVVAAAVRRCGEVSRAA